MLPSVWSFFTLHEASALPDAPGPEALRVTFNGRVDSDVARRLRPSVPPMPPVTILTTDHRHFSLAAGPHPRRCHGSPLARRGLSQRLSAQSALQSGPYFISSITFFNSSGIGGIGARATSISPSLALRVMMLNVANAGSLSGWSSR